MRRSSRASAFHFDRIQGQERPIALLRDAVRTGHVSQAYLFHGPWGVGKTTTALALAAALNCESPDERPCGRCLACRKTASFNHPDVHLLMPLYPAGLWKEEAEKGTSEEPGESPLCRLFGEWAENPFHVFHWPKRPTIATEWVLEVRREASRKTFEGRTKVIIFSGVEAMGVEAANRILKMLEEPGPSTVFALTTSRLHRVLPTIRSRCQRIAFGEVPRETIRRILIERLGTPEREAELLASLARGSVARGIALCDEGILETREWTLGLVRSKGSELAGRLADEVLGDSRRWNVRTVRQVAEVLLAWYRDLLAVKHRFPEKRITNQDRLEDLAAEASRLDVRELRRRVRVLDDLIRDVEHQVTPSAALFAALVEADGGIETDPAA